MSTLSEAYKQYSDWEDVDRASNYLIAVNEDLINEVVKKLYSKANNFDQIKEIISKINLGEYNDPLIRAYVLFSVVFFAYEGMRESPDEIIRAILPVGTNMGKDFDYFDVKTLNLIEEFLRMYIHEMPEKFYAMFTTLDHRYSLQTLKQFYGGLELYLEAKNL